MNDDATDLGRCISAKCEDMGGEPGRLVALVSDDGSAWQADVCPRCHCSWWHQVPKTPPGPEVKRMTESELQKLRAFPPGPTEQPQIRMATAPGAGDGATE